MKPLSIEKNILENIDTYLPSIIQPSITGERSLKIKSKKLREIIFENGAKYNNIKKQLQTINGEKYNGKLEMIKTRISNELSCHLSNGTYNWPTGEQYKGAFNKNNSFQGESLLIFKDESSLQCKFDNGYPCEGGRYISKNSKTGIDITISSNFQKSLKNKNNYYYGGKTIINVKNKTSIKFYFMGKFEQDKVNGEIIIKKLMEDRRLVEIRANYKNGKLNGKTEIKDIKPGGTFLLSGEYKFGFRDGLFKIVDKLNDINIKQEFHYLRDNLNILEKITKKIKKINYFYKLVDLYKIKKRYINLYNNLVKKLIFLNSRNRYKEFVKEVLATCIEKFNRKYGTQFKGNEKIIHIKDKNLGNDGFNLLCGCDFNDLKDLALQNCKLNDISPLANATFTEITNLSLGTNQINSLEFIKKIKFPNLKNLLLGGNLINSLLPLENYSSENLKVLFLLDNKINNIEPLIKLKTPNLEELYLGNDISELNPLSKCNFKLLKQLSLCKNKIENISILENCDFKNLEVLVLSNNKIVDVSPLIKCNFPKLKKISLRSNCIKEIKIFTKFKNLKQLDIAQNNFSPDNSVNKMIIEELNSKLSSLITK